NRVTVPDDLDAEQGQGEMRDYAPMVPDLEPSRGRKADDPRGQHHRVEDHCRCNGAVANHRIETLLARLIDGREAVAQDEVKPLDERHDQYGQAERRFVAYAVTMREAIGEARGDGRDGDDGRLDDPEIAGVILVVVAGGELLVSVGELRADGRDRRSFPQAQSLK